MCTEWRDFVLVRHEESLFLNKWMIFFNVQTHISTPYESSKSLKTHEEWISISIMEVETWGRNAPLNFQSDRKTKNLLPLVSSELKWECWAVVSKQILEGTWNTRFHLYFQPHFASPCPPPMSLTSHIHGGCTAKEPGSLLLTRDLHWSVCWLDTLTGIWLLSARYFRGQSSTHTCTNTQQNVEMDGGTHSLTLYLIFSSIQTWNPT